MSIQDDIFDVTDALKKRPEKASFGRIVGYLSRLEEKAERADRLLSALGTVVNVASAISKEEARNRRAVRDSVKKVLGPKPSSPVRKSSKWVKEET